MAENNYPGEVELVSRGQHAKIVSRIRHIPPRPRPAAARRADPPKLNAPRRGAQPRQGAGEIAHVAKSEPRQKTPAVNDHDHRVWTAAGRQP